MCWRTSVCAQPAHISRRGSNPRASCVMFIRAHRPHIGPREGSIGFDSRHGGWRTRLHRRGCRRASPRADCACAASCAACDGGKSACPCSARTNKSMHANPQTRTHARTHALTLTPQRRRGRVPRRMWSGSAYVHRLLASKQRQGHNRCTGKEPSLGTPLLGVNGSWRGTHAYSMARASESVACKEA